MEIRTCCVQFFATAQPRTRKGQFATAHPTLIYSIQRILLFLRKIQRILLFLRKKKIQRILWRRTAKAVPSDELSTGSPLFAGGAAGASVAPSAPPARAQQARAGSEALLRPSTWRQRALRPASAAAAATRGGGVASFHLARRRWRRPEGRRDGARLAPRRSRCENWVERHGNASVQVSWSFNKLDGALSSEQDEWSSRMYHQDQAGGEQNILDARHNSRRYMKPYRGEERDRKVKAMTRRDFVAEAVTPWWESLNYSLDF